MDAVTSVPVPANEPVRQYPPGSQDRTEGSGDWPVPPIGRIGQASDVAAAAVFYASSEAEFITGTTLLVDGGMTAGYLQRERNGQ